MKYLRPIRPTLRRWLHPLRLVLLFLDIVLSATATHGQLTDLGPPPGGYALRQVTHLSAVPEPPGGLVPYRAGKLWGYCDTLGRVWIQPTFPREPSFFAQGFAYAPNQVQGKRTKVRRGVVADILFDMLL